MTERQDIKKLASTVEQLRQLCQELYDNSEDFPAVNRNAKRILASAEMLRVNLEES
ncbi:MAG TPA: hypothetical protein VMC85_21320 [Desulfomonilaceae bacterium]|nr:hypothetical protein [Desulfomonilaceae bacterium]